MRKFERLRTGEQRPGGPLHPCSGYKWNERHVRARTKYPTFLSYLDERGEDLYETFAFNRTRHARHTIPFFEELRRNDIFESRNNFSSSFSLFVLETNRFSTLKSWFQILSNFLCKLQDSPKWTETECVRILDQRVEGKFSN